MNRIEGWEIRLIAYLEERQDMPFQWGSQDCCRFACGGLVAQGLADPMSGVRTYKTARGAAGMIARHGGTLEIAATNAAAKAGLREVAPAFAGRGCPVLAEIETPSGCVAPALGLVGIDGLKALFAGTDGLVDRPLSECRRAWGLD